MGLYSASLDVKRNQQRYNLLSSSPGYATTTIEFNGVPSVSESITLTNTSGFSVEFSTFVSSSTDSGSADSFQTGSSAVEAATFLYNALESGSLNQMSFELT